MTVVGSFYCSQFYVRLNASVSSDYNLKMLHTLTKDESFSKEAKLLQDHVARRAVPKVAILVHVQHAFFHCSKAYMRSKLWDPSSWPKKEFQVRFGQYFSPKDSEAAKSVDRRVMDAYAKVQLAIDGHCEEE